METTIASSRNMNFAVIEYSSKTGTVWRHTKMRPNYLADPVKEMDPTSFGCYVSALKGEHVPLTGLIVGPVNSVAPLTRWYRKAYKHIRRQWPQDYSLKYIQKFDVVLVVHQLSDAHELVLLLRRLRLQKTRPLIVGVPTQPYGILQDAFKAAPRAEEDFASFMSLCDVFLSIVKDTKIKYQQLTHTPVVYLPQPYPVEFATQCLTPYEHKADQILVAGVTQRADIRKGQGVARLVQQQFPEYEIVIPKVPGLEYDTENLQGTRYRLLPFEEWRDHLRTLAKVKLVINTDYTYTRGRVQVDCAAVGTPSLGANSDAQADLFPSLSSKPSTTVDELADKASTLLRDRSLYTSVVATASEGIKKYNYAASAERLQQLVTQRAVGSSH